MDLACAAILFAAGLLAGATNAAAGGGSFVTIPAMVAAGMPAVAANASSTVALLPGTIAGAWAWRRGFRPFGGVPIRTMLLISLGCGLAGALLLLATPALAFDALPPRLLLTATLTFFGRRLGKALRRHVSIGPGAVVGAQVVLSVYAGYFGGVVGALLARRVPPPMLRWTVILFHPLRRGDDRGVLPAGLGVARVDPYRTDGGQVRWRTGCGPGTTAAACALHVRPPAETQPMVEAILPTPCSNSSGPSWAWVQAR